MNTTTTSKSNGSDAKPEVSQEIVDEVAAETAQAQVVAQADWDEGVDTACAVLEDADALRKEATKRTRRDIFKALKSRDAEAVRGFARKRARQRVKARGPVTRS